MTRIAVLDTGDWESDPTYGDSFTYVGLTQEQMRELEEGNESVLDDGVVLRDQHTVRGDGLPYDCIVAVLDDGRTWAEGAFYIDLPDDVLEALDNGKRPDLSPYMPGGTQMKTWPVWLYGAGAEVDWDEIMFDLDGKTRQ